MYKLKYNKNIRTSFRLILVVIVLRKFNFQFLKLVGYTQEKSSKLSVVNNEFRI